MKITAEPRSDQYNADDFVGGPREFTIAGVRVGTAEQKYDLLLVGEERCWRPPLTVLRILLAAWGDDASDWAGKRDGSPLKTMHSGRAEAARQDERTIMSYSGGLPLHIVRVYPDLTWRDLIEQALIYAEQTIADIITRYLAATAGMPATEYIDHYEEMSL